MGPTQRVGVEPLRERLYITSRTARTGCMIIAVTSAPHHQKFDM